MRAPAGWFRAGRGAVALALLAAGVAAPGTSAGGPWPGLSATAGRTFAVSGTPNEGGVALALAALWPVGGPGGAPVRLGVALFADDMGDEIGQLRDPHDGTPLGAAALFHRQALGWAWRLDAAPRPWGRWQPYASGSWGYYRITDDVRGARTAEAGTTGFSVGGGLHFAAGKNLRVGAAARYHRLFEDRIGRYMDAGLDLAWR